MRLFIRPSTTIAIGLFIGLSSLAWLSGGKVINAHPLQQTEPAAIIDAVIQDLNQKLGRSFTRATVDNWAWEEDIFPDAGLGCPQPGQTYASGQTRGYKISVIINGVVYDYRARKDNSVFFLCSPAANTILPLPSQPTARPATAVPPPTALPALLTTIPVNIGVITPIAGAGTPRTELAYIAPDGNVHFMTLGPNNINIPLTTDAAIQPTAQNMIADPTFSSTRSYGYLRWSPDGTKLMFVELSTRAIYIEVSGYAPVMVVGDYGLGRDAAFPPTWSPDGTQIAFVAHKPNAAQDAGQLLTLNPDNGQPATVIADLSCSAGGSPAPLDEATYLRDLNRQENRSPAFLAWVGADVLFGGSCSDLTAVDIQSKTVHWTAHSVTRPALAPDNKHVAALTTTTIPQVVLVDLSSGAPVALPGVPNNVDQITWLGDGQNLIFSTFTPGVGIAGDATSRLGKQLFGNNWPLNGRSRLINLWSIPAIGGTPTKIFESEGYQIGMIAVFPADNSLTFSRITSMKPLVQALNAPPSAASVTNVDKAVPHAELLFIGSPLAAHNVNTLVTLALGGQPAGSFGTFIPTATNASAATGTALPLVQTGPTSTLSVSIVASSNGQCPGAPPSRLVLGAPGHVTPGDPNLLRDQAGSTRTLGIIPAGAVFTVLQGPLCATNGVAWWQVSYNGLTGWTAEGQGTNYYLAP